MKLNKNNHIITEVTMQRIRKYKGLHLIIILAFLFTLISVWASAADNNKERRLLENFKAGNHIALLRHALAPGIGDPQDFRLDDCTTQRNLSSAGREQAVRIGSKLKQAGIVKADVYTSQWCRCLDTAELLGLGRPALLPALNSFFRDHGNKESHTEQLRKWLSQQQLARPLILVTHQVNITAFSTIYPESGEIVLMHRNDEGQFQVAGSIRTD